MRRFPVICSILRRLWSHRSPPFQSVAAILIAAGNLPAQASTSLVLSSSVNPSIFGQPVTLTATITPSAATGKVTFYDGTNVLGSAAVSSGVASLVTIGIGYGARNLTARYIGNSGYSPSVSSGLTENITTKPGGSFTLAN